MSADNYVTIHNHPGPNGGYAWCNQFASADVENKPALDNTRYETVEEAVSAALAANEFYLEYGFQFRLANNAEDDE